MIGKRALLYLLYILNSCNRSFRVKRARLLNYLKPVLNISRISIENAALPKIKGNPKIEDHQARGFSKKISMLILLQMTREIYLIIQLKNLFNRQYFYKI